MAEPIYIHYGDTAFYPYEFCPIHNRQGLNKPYGGLWVSRVDADFRNYILCLLIQHGSTPKKAFLMRLLVGILREKKNEICTVVLEAHDNPYLLDMVIAPLIDPDSLSVGTRRTDENGMDIYTGDIVEYYWMGDIRIGTVVFEDDTFRVKDNSNNCEGKLQDVKSVIGNIWGVEADVES